MSTVWWMADAQTKYWGATWTAWHLRPVLSGLQLWCLITLGSHAAKRIKESIERWAAKGLRLYCLPPCCPHLNLVERWWKNLKGFLMPRRCYDSLAQLKEVLLTALDALAAITL